MITLSKATQLAQSYVQEMAKSCGISLQLLEDQTIERSFGWAFFYDAVREPGLGDFDTLLAGNAPFIIDKRDGSLHVTGTAFTIEKHLDNYERTSTPYPD
jgi:hypothetical protein